MIIQLFGFGKMLILFTSAPVVLVLLKDRHTMQRKKKILGECILISSLPGKALRTLVDIADLPSESTCVLKAEPGKLDIKRREPGLLFISVQAV